MTWLELECSPAPPAARTHGADSMISRARVPGLASSPPFEEGVLREILRVLLERTGVDVCQYRPATVQRRIMNRMISLGIPTPGEYLLVLGRDQTEPSHLLQRIMIKVSRFYRNRVTFDLLRERVIPELALAAGNAPLRIWCAGCGRGEEAYTLAMVLDAAGVAGTVYATDIDAHALQAAPTYAHPVMAALELPSDLADRYLEPVTGTQDSRVRVRECLRDRVRFIQHDLTSDAPLATSETFDLVCCRNVLIYLQPAVQERVLALLRRATRPGGFLCLGEAEWPLPSVAASLTTLAHKARVFRAATGPDDRGVQ